MKLFIRPGKREDLPALLHFSKMRASGITSLPQDSTLLKKKLESSEKAFQGDAGADYLFVLQSQDKIVGVSAIKTAVGKTIPSFAYELTSELRKCNHLKLEYEFARLNFETIQSHPTEICSLFLEGHYRKRHLGRLLSYCRFLFMSGFPDRFSKLILAQLRGVSDKRGSPFWDAVGKNFYNMTFDQAELLRATHPEVIAELFPRTAIYPAMLPKRAQKVIGVPHKSTVPARLLLEKEGFAMSAQCDLFDAGPLLYAKRDAILAIKESKVGRLRIQKIQKLDSHMISNDSLDFRAVVAPLVEVDHEIILNPETASLLHAKEGDTLRYLRV